MPEFTFSGIAQYAGKELGVSSWVTVDQSRINQFAECSGDRQWIHVDVARAKRESPYRAPIAHGYLTLALVAPLQMEIGAVPTDAGAMAGASGRGYLYQVVAMTGWTSLPWLWKLKQPSLILAGTDDPIIPLINARVMARLMPNARLEILDEVICFW